MENPFLNGDQSLWLKGRWGEMPTRARERHLTQGCYILCSSQCATIGLEYFPTGREGRTTERALCHTLLSLLPCCKLSLGPCHSSAQLGSGPPRAAASL